MKKYHVENYVRYKHDMSANLKRLPYKPFKYNLSKFISWRML